MYRFSLAWYHQDSIQVCVLDEQGKVLLNRAAANDWRELGRLVSPLGVVQRVGIEACCGAADLGEELVERLGWEVSLGHPAYIAKTRNSPDKSDYSDGRLVADLTRVGYLPRVWLAPANIRELRRLVNHRQRLVDRGRALKLQVGGLLREQRVKIDKGRGSRWSKGWTASVRDNDALSKHARWIVNDLLDDLKYTQSKVAKVDARLREATAGDAVVKKLMEQPGVGEVTAWVLGAYVGDFARFKTAKQLAWYCGMSPCNASSGRRQADAGAREGGVCDRRGDGQPLAAEPAPRDEDDRGDEDDGGVNRQQPRTEGCRGTRRSRQGNASAARRSIGRGSWRRARPPLGPQGSSRD